MKQRVVVDGSNLATEGRTLPNLVQLEQCVTDYMGEHPALAFEDVTVVVDSTFPHRIVAAERGRFEEAYLAGEIVTPPAGAVGRGDAFILLIARKTNAIVLSNDSFQEFHAEHPWLFEPGRLMGGKPVPGVGWIFTPRNPVRGDKSRAVTRDAKRTKTKTGWEVGSGEISAEAPLVSAEELLEKGRAALAKLPRKAVAVRRGRSSDAGMVAAMVEASEPGALDGDHNTPVDLDGRSDGAKKRGRRRGARTEPRAASAPPVDAVNDPATFLAFVTAHAPGDLVVGVVDNFSSHGAYVVADGARCYIPMTLMADPPPRAAREVLTKGASTTFVLRGFDTARRSIELAVQGVGGSVAALVTPERDHEAPSEASARGGRTRGGAAKASKTAAVAASAPIDAPGRAGAAPGEPESVRRPRRSPRSAPTTSLAPASRALPTVTSARADVPAAAATAVPVKRRSPGKVVPPDEPAAPVTATAGRRPPATPPDQSGAGTPKSLPTRAAVAKRTLKRSPAVDAPGPGSSVTTPAAGPSQRRRAPAAKAAAAPTSAKATITEPARPSSAAVSGSVSASKSKARTAKAATPTVTAATVTAATAKTIPARAVPAKAVPAKALPVKAAVRAAATKTPVKKAAATSEAATSAPTKAPVKKSDAVKVDAPKPSATAGTGSKRARPAPTTTSGTPIAAANETTPAPAKGSAAVSKAAAATKAGSPAKVVPARKTTTPPAPAKPKKAAKT